LGTGNDNIGTTDIHSNMWQIRTLIDSDGKEIKRTKDGQEIRDFGIYVNQSGVESMLEIFNSIFKLIDETGVSLYEYQLDGNGNRTNKTKLADD
jgi:hypothetical protein